MCKKFNRSIGINVVPYPLLNNKSGEDSGRREKKEKVREEAEERRGMNYYLCVAYSYRVVIYVQVTIHSKRFSFVL